MPDNLFRSHSLEKSSNEGKVVTSGALTIWEDKPVSPLDVGDTFQPVPNGPVLTVKRVNINDNVIGLNAGQPVRQWQISIEGSDETDNSDSGSERHSFSIEQDDDNVIHSGSVSTVAVGDNPPNSISVGSIINFPGVGSIQCTKITGSDDFNEYGQRVWHLTYEGTDAPQSSGLDDALNTKYSFTIDNEHSGSMQVVNEGNTPAVTLDIGSKFHIPGIGEVTCSKISGSDDYSHNGIRRWTVTYEGYSGHEDSDTRYSFSCDYSSGVYSGSKQVTYYGDAPALELHEGGTFSIPCAGKLICTKATGSDEFTADGRHKWTLTYEGSSAGNSADVPDTKYSLNIEKNSEGTLSSGTMTVTSTGERPILDVEVGKDFYIPGIGNVTCSKVSGSDSYSEDGTHKWTMTYEGYYNGQNQDGEASASLSHSKYSFAIDNSSQSGSIEVSVFSDDPNPLYSVGDEIRLPGIDQKLICSKVSGSDSYDDNGQRKWTIVYEASSTFTDELGVRYSFSSEKNSEGVTVITGTKQYHPVVYPNGKVEAPTTEVEDEFTIPYGNKEKRLKCTKVSGNLDDSGVWTYTIEGQGTSDTDGSSSDSGDSGSGDSDSSLPESEASTSYEINGLTVRTVDGTLVALRRSETPITRKSITIYNDSETRLATPGNDYENFGIAVSENVSRETIKSNGVVIKTYYKHSIEVEA